MNLLTTELFSFEIHSVNNCKSNAHCEYSKLNYIVEVHNMNKLTCEFYKITFHKIKKKTHFDLFFFNTYV